MPSLDLAAPGSILGNAPDMFLGKAKSLWFGTILRPELGHCGSVSERDHSPPFKPLVISPFCLYFSARNYRLSRFYAKFYKRPGGDYRDFPWTSGVGPVDDRVVPGDRIGQEEKREETAGRGGNGSAGDKVAEGCF